MRQVWIPDHLELPARALARDHQIGVAVQLVAVSLNAAIAASARATEVTAPVPVRIDAEPSVIVSPELLKAALGRGADRPARPAEALRLIG